MLKCQKHMPFNVGAMFKTWLYIKKEIRKRSFKSSIGGDTYSLTQVFLTIDRKEDFQCSTKTKNLKLPPKSTLLTTNTIHQCTAMKMKKVMAFP